MPDTKPYSLRADPDSERVLQVFDPQTGWQTVPGAAIIAYELYYQMATRSKVIAHTVRFDTACDMDALPPPIKLAVAHLTPATETESGGNVQDQEALTSTEGSAA